MEAKHEDVLKYMFGLGSQTRPIQMAKVPGRGEAQPIMVIGKEEQLVRLEEHVPNDPDRIRQVVELNSVTSFAEYVRKWKTMDTVIFENTLASPYVFTAVIDYHQVQEESDGELLDHVPSWTTHVVRLTLTETREWKAWCGASGKLMGQDEFATFVEQNLMDIVEPDGATMLEIALGLEATQETGFSQKLNLSNGDVGFVCDQKTNLRAGKDGTLRVPSEMTLRIAPFRGMTPGEIVARVRTKLVAPRLGIGVELIRPEQMIDVLVSCIRKQLSETLEVPIYSGSVNI